MNRRLICILLTGTLAGCAAVDRAPPAASVVLPERLALAAPYDGSGTLDRLIPVDDPAFAALLRMAMQSAPDLGIAVARIDAARTQVRSAGAAQLPELNASANAARERLSANQFGTGALPPDIPLGGSRTTFNPRIDASWDADLFGRLRADKRAAAFRLDAAVADAAGVRLALTSDIAQAVTDYRTLAVRAEVIEDDRKSATDFAAITAERARSGLIPGADRVRADALAADATSRAAALERERAAIIGRLITLTATDGSAILSALDQAVPATASTGAVPALSASIVRQRPDVLAAERRLAAADQDIASAAAQRFPRLTLSAGLGLFALALGDLFTEDAITGSLGAGLAGPLLDFGRVGALIDQRQATARESFESYRQTVFRALGEVEAALGQIEGAQAQLIALERQAALDGDALSLARERYRLGLDTLLTAIDAERTANRSREAVVLARAEIQRQRIALYRAAGGAPQGTAP